MKKCATCGMVDERLGCVAVKYYCFRYRRNMNAESYCIDWVSKASISDTVKAARHPKPDV